MKTFGTTAAVLALALGAVAGNGALAQSTPYYEGKTIRVIVGLRAGGTADTFIRTFADYWQKHIPGNPTIVVENMPGSGNLLATNHVYEAVEPDGLTLVYGPWNPAAQALGDETLRADYSKMEYIGAASDIRVSYMRKDVAPGMETPADLAKAETFNLGGNGPSDFVDLMGRMSLDLLGVEYNYVTGYRGGSDLYAAMLSNEIQMANTSYGTLVTRSADFIAPDGDGMPAYQFCPSDGKGGFGKPDLELDIPCFQELYETIKGGQPSGDVWQTLDWYVGLAARVTFLALAPPGTPEDAVAALREGFDKAALDSELQALFIERSGVPVEFVPLDEGRAALASLGSVPEVVKTTLRDYIESGQQ